MTKTSDWIYDYLAATRRVLPEKVRSDGYSNVGALLAKGAFGRAPKFMVTYSYLGATEIVARNSDCYLIYDQFAGECFAGLNWLLGTQASPMAVRSLLDFIIGQRVIHARTARPL